MSRVTFHKTKDRKDGVQKSLEALGRNPVKGKSVFIKPNFNTADPAPGSSHNDTLAALIDEIWAMGAKSIMLGDRSYPSTRSVMEKKGILPLLKEKGVEVIDFDELDDADWIEFKLPDSHWPDGFRIARPIIEAECLVSTGCLKTHQFGGIFTLSLKLHVGVVPTGRNGYPYMSQLHGSPHQRKMIAEVNQPFSPDLIVMDGIDVFVDGGPATGKRVKGNVFLASTDRVAIDAVGISVLKTLGSNPAIMNRAIFEQEQISRAVDLGLGVSSPSEIEIVPVDSESRQYCQQVHRILAEG
ncbi:MAG: DUF362 domain-containing protein [Deltaproteobacteria bacterium]|nr:DUF362 domain-containing protein [Deltaproteobacteria bacterium]MBW2151316.1 DUF362 domain-containing protein [Deltaproteobacteria bacterium]